MSIVRNVALAFALTVPAMGCVEELKTNNDKSEQANNTGSKIDSKSKQTDNKSNQPEYSIGKINLSGFNPSHMTLESYDYNRNNQYELQEALEFYYDNAKKYFGANIDENYNGKISAKEIQKVSDWYQSIINEIDEGTKCPPAFNKTIHDKKNREAYFDIIATLNASVRNGNEVQDLELPCLLTPYDVNKDGKITIFEARDIYENHTGKKLEVFSNGLLPPASCRRLIDYFHEKSNQFALSNKKHLAGTFNGIHINLKSFYKEVYGGDYTPPSK